MMKKKQIKRNTLCALSGLLSLLSLFLPFSPAGSFYDSISGPGWGCTGPAAVLLLALTTLLYALGLSELPRDLGTLLLLIYLLFLGCAVRLAGLPSVLAQLRVGGWLLLLGLHLLSWGPVFLPGPEHFSC